MNLSAVLSKREMELVPYLISRRSKKQIADELFRSVRTIECHSRNIFGKIEITKNTELCIWYFVKHFSIPLEALPKSLIAGFLLTLFIPFAFHTDRNELRAGRRSRRFDDYEYVIEN